MNSDGKADRLHLSLEMPLPSGFDVLLTRIVLLFDCKLQVSAGSISMFRRAQCSAGSHSLMLLLCFFQNPLVGLSCNWLYLHTSLPSFFWLSSTLFFIHTCVHLELNCRPILVFTMRAWHGQSTHLLCLGLSGNSSESFACSSRSCFAMVFKTGKMRYKCCVSYKAV